MCWINIGHLLLHLFGFFGSTQEKLKQNNEIFNPETMPTHKEVLLTFLVPLQEPPATFIPLPPLRLISENLHPLLPALQTPLYPAPQSHLCLHRDVSCGIPMRTSEPESVSTLSKDTERKRIARHHARESDGKSHCMALPRWEASKMAGTAPLCVDMRLSPESKSRFPNIT